MKTIFLGTPAIAVPFLEALAKQAEVLGVVTNPDQPSGRHYQVHASPVKEAAARRGLPVFQPEKAGEPGFLDTVRCLQPELGIVVAYGKLLPKSLLAVPKLGFLNVHFSLLPAYRGAAPIQWTLIHGEKETGVTLFWLDEGMDTGPIFIQERMTVAPEDDADSLRKKLVALGVEALAAALKRLAAGDKTALPQVGTASKAPMLSKEDGRLDWARPAQELVNRLRGVTPWPGAYAMVEHGGRLQRLKILKARVDPGPELGDPGTVIRLDGSEGFVIKCGKDSLKVLQVQPEGKKTMSAWDFWQGARLKLNDKLS